MRLRPCTHCASSHKGKYDICRACRIAASNQARKNSSLKGGSWVRRGLVYVYEWDYDRPARVPEPATRMGCGTIAAYRKHLRHKQPTCDACRRANAEDRAERKAKATAERAAKRLREQTKTTTRLAAELWLTEIQKEERTAA